MVLIAFICSAGAAGIVFWIFALRFTLRGISLGGAVESLGPAVTDIAIAEVVLSFPAALTIGILRVTPPVWAFIIYGLVCSELNGAFFWLLLSPWPYHLAPSDAFLAEMWAVVGATAGAMFGLIAVRRGP